MRLFNILIEVGCSISVRACSVCVFSRISTTLICRGLFVNLDMLLLMFTTISSIGGVLTPILLRSGFCVGA